MENDELRFAEREQRAITAALQNISARATVEHNKFRAAQYIGIVVVIYARLATIHPFVDVAEGEFVTQPKATVNNNPPRRPCSYGYSGANRIYADPAVCYRDI